MSLMEAAYHSPVARGPAFAIALAVAAALGVCRASAAPVIVPGEPSSPSVEALGAPEAIEAFAVSADGAVAVAAVPSSRPGRSALRVARVGLPPVDIELDGTVQGLALTPAGDAAFLVVRVADKKGVVRRTSLESAELATRRVVERASLPASSRGAALGAADTVLLVAAKDELRSFTLPDVSSGPLYRVPGDNVAVASIAGSSRVLVAQGRRIVVVDLAAPQDRDGLAIFEAVEATADVSVLVAAPDEPSGLALLADGRVAAIGVDPLRLSDRGTARALAWPGVRAPVEARPAPIELPPAPPPPPATSPVAAPPVAAPVPVPVEAATEEPPPATGSAAAGTIRGTVAGPERAAVRAIVVLGPDNILREAAQVVPDGAGRWTVSGLKAGTYRVVAAGDTGRVLICDPPYVTVRVGADGAVEAPALNAMRVH